MQNNQRILNFCSEKGFLINNDLLEILSKTSSEKFIENILEKAMLCSKKKVITINFFNENFDKIFSNFSKEYKEDIEIIKKGIGFKEKEKEIIKKEKKGLNNTDIEILSENHYADKKIGVPDFVNYFKERFNLMKSFLMEHRELENLVSINKISRNRQGISLIGMVVSKRVTKNKNILLEIEDNTGRIRALVNKSKEEIYNDAENICLDSVLGFKGSGNGEIFFVNDLVFPDSKIPKRKNSDKEEYALFIGDLHFGSKKFLKKSFSKFLLFKGKHF